MRADVLYVDDGDVLTSAGVSSVLRKNVSVGDDIHAVNIIIRRAAVQTAASNGPARRRSSANEKVRRRPSKKARSSSRMGANASGSSGGDPVPSASGLSPREMETRPSDDAATQSRPIGVSSGAWKTGRGATWGCYRGPSVYSGQARKRVLCSEQ